MIISIKTLAEALLDNYNNAIIKCKENDFIEQNNAYSIIYNNRFELVNYKNFSEHNQCFDLENYTIIFKSK